MLKIANNLSLPVDAVTESIGILAKRRSGKSYAARRLVEQFAKARQQVVIVDPKGDWWGIIHGRDGTSKGLPFVICGGERGHVPIEPSAGETVARLVVEDRVSVVLDLSRFRKHECATFMTGFMEALYRLKARAQYREAVMLVIDEADAIAPQKPQKGEERMLGAAEDLVKRGGQRGIGVTLITQRAAVINKNVLTQISILITLRTIAPQDRAAINAWVEVHGTKAQQATMMESLASLPQGTAWVWAPGWPKDDGIFSRVDILPIETFDSFATPKAGERLVAPKNAADVDLEAFKREMAATIERAKADDPKALRQEITALKRELAAKPAVAPVAAVETVKVSVLEGEDLKHAERLADRLTAEADKLDGVAVKVIARADELRDEAVRVRTVIGKATAPAGNTPRNIPSAVRREAPQRLAAAAVPPRPAASGSRPADGGAGLTGPEQRIVDAIAWLNSIGVDDPEQVAVAFLAGYTYGGGAFNNPRGALRTRGMVEYVGGDRIRLTEAGAAAANEPGAPLSSEELHARILDRLPGPEQRLLRPLLAAYPSPMTNEDLAAAAGYTAGAGAFNNPRGRLRSLGLVEYPAPGHVVARSILFLGD